MQYFTKMHSLGNDFIIIDDRADIFERQAWGLPALANRYQGIGFDQCLVLQNDVRPDHFFCRIFNADGSEAEQCGNGLRCLAYYIQQKKLHPALSFYIATKAGTFPITLTDSENIRVTMGIPQIQDPSFILDLAHPASPFTLSLISMGNPHAILPVQNLEEISFASLGQTISQHDSFPGPVNVGFMQIETPHHIRLHTFERGAGLTLACGSNACAAVAAGIIHGQLATPVTVEFSLGKLTIEWQGPGHALTMTGPACMVYEGKVSKSPAP